MPIILRLVALFPAFSDIEASMQATLWHFAGVSTPTAQAVFSGTRIEGAIPTTFIPLSFPKIPSGLGVASSGRIVA